jgi:hypothetical protein
LEESKAYGERLRKTLAKNCEQTKYWYELWLSSSKKFVVAQNIMTEEIDRLRKKAGEWDGKPYLEKRLIEEANRMNLNAPCREGKKKPESFQKIVQEAGCDPFASDTIVAQSGDAT